MNPTNPSDDNQTQNPMSPTMGAGGNDSGAQMAQPQADPMAAQPAQPVDPMAQAPAAPTDQPAMGNEPAQPMATEPMVKPEGVQSDGQANSGDNGMGGVPPVTPPPAV